MRLIEVQLNAIYVIYIASIFFELFGISTTKQILPQIKYIFIKLR